MEDLDATVSQLGEKHGDGFVVCEHERWHPVTRCEPVTAVPPAYGLHRQIEVEQVVDVAAQGLARSVLPGRSLPSSPMSARTGGSPSLSILRRTRPSSWDMNNPSMPWNPV